MSGRPQHQRASDVQPCGTAARAHGDRVAPLNRPGARGQVLVRARTTMDAAGWLDPPALVRLAAGTVVHERRNRFVRRIDLDGHPLYVKVHHPLDRGRSPAVEFRNHLVLRAAGFGAPEPWLWVVGPVEGRDAGILVTREAPGIVLDEYAAGVVRERGVRDLHAMARGIGQAVRALHTAHFFHPDLQAWHVYVDGSPAGGKAALTYIDLQRLERGGPRIRRRKAAEGLAALSLSLREVVPPRLQLAALRAYLGGTLDEARPWLAAIRRRTAKLERKGTFRHLRERGEASMQRFGGGPEGAG